jgi:hypothetical protein
MDAVDVLDALAIGLLALDLDLPDPSELLKSLT